LPIAGYETLGGFVPLDTHDQPATRTHKLSTDN
jgi:hypothetical protein